jgi:exocyst complex component 3
LLEFEDTVAKIVENFNTLGVNCKKMREELGEKRLTSGISVARRNLKELENQIAFYEELPSKVHQATCD